MEAIIFFTCVIAAFFTLLVIAKRSDNKRPVSQRDSRYKSVRPIKSNRVRNTFRTTTVRSKTPRIASDAELQQLDNQLLQDEIDEHLADFDNIHMRIHGAGYNAVGDIN